MKFRISQKERGIIVNEDKWIKCTKCGVSISPEFEPEFARRKGDEKQFEQISDGIKLVFSCGYGMFTDNLAYGDPVAFLCHDCVVKLLEFFPESFKERFKGGHPYSHKPNGRCCEYAWSFEEENNG
jgi:hypothetical protein